MKQHNKIQTAIVLLLLMLAIWLRFSNPYQSLLLEMTSDLFIVVILLGFSEVLMRLFSSQFTLSQKHFIFLKYNPLTDET